MAEKKWDMSTSCGLMYDKYWADTHVHHTMSEEYFKKWFMENCARCKWMSEVCMFGEDKGPSENSDKEDDSANPGNLSIGETQTTTSQMNPASNVDRANLKVLIDIARAATKLTEHGLDKLPMEAWRIHDYVYRASSGGIDKTEIRLAPDTFGFVSKNDAPFAFVYLWTMIMTDYGTTLRPNGLVGYITDVDAVLEFTKAVGELNKED